MLLGSSPPIPTPYTMPLHATPYNPFFSHDWIEPWVCQIDVLYKKGKSYLLRFYCLYGQLTPHTLQLLEEGEEGKVQPNLRMKLEVPLQVCHVKNSFMELAIPFLSLCLTAPLFLEKITKYHLILIELVFGP